MGPRVTWRGERLEAEDDEGFGAGLRLIARGVAAVEPEVELEAEAEPVGSVSPVRGGDSSVRSMRTDMAMVGGVEERQWRWGKRQMA